MQHTRFHDMDCPIARTLDRVGEWWSMLILRDAFAGMTRFDEFEKSLGIAPNMLTRRLTGLVKSGLLEKRRYSAKPPRFEYLLTARGRDFRPVLLSLLAYGNRHYAPEGASVLVVDAETGAPADPVVVDRASGRILAEPEFQMAAGPSATEATRTRLAAAPSPFGRAALERATLWRARMSAVAAALGASEAPRATEMSPRTRMLLSAPILPTLLTLAWPNVLVMLAQASTGLIETWWVSHLGADALAGMALVFPGYMMMGMLSAGAVGGGIASAVARALGAGRRSDADALAFHALDHQHRAGRRDLGAVPRFRPADLFRDGRRGRFARRGDALFERRVRGQRAAVGDERLRERHSRLGHHDVSVAGRLLRRRAVDPPFADLHLRLGADAGARRRGRRRRHRVHHGADDAAAGLARVHRAGAGAVEGGTPALADVLRYLEGRRRWRA